LVQPGRHLDLPDHGGGVHRSGDQHPHGHYPPDHPAAGAAAVLQRRCGRDRFGLHRAGGHTVGRRSPAGGRSGADPGYRPLHVG
nr:hypothetical protein [Tanacetum cinerariifolium]